MKKEFGLIWLVLPLVLSGCVVVVNSEQCFSAKEENRVGGGLVIDYRAKEDGTAILVDKKSGKTIETMSLSEGELFSFAVGQEEKEKYRQLGVDLKKANFVLYFYPKNAQTDPAEQP
jgi:hypothetical protein